jgi:hypothetical protein
MQSNQNNINIKNDKEKPVDKDMKDGEDWLIGKEYILLEVSLYWNIPQGLSYMS